MAQNKKYVINYDDIMVHAELFSEATSCCGILDVHGVDFVEPEEFLWYVNENLSGPRCVLFSSAYKPNWKGQSSASRIAEFVCTHKFGEVTPPAMSINRTGNKIEAYLWTLTARQRTSFSRWVKTNFEVIRKPRPYRYMW